MDHGLETHVVEKCLGHTSIRVVGTWYTVPISVIIVRNCSLDDAFLRKLL